MSGCHGGRWRLRGGRGRREQPAGPDYPAPEPEAAEVDLWESAILPDDADIAGAREVLQLAPGALQRMTIAEIAVFFDRLLWAGSVLDAAYRAQAAMTQRPDQDPPWEVLT